MARLLLPNIAVVVISLADRTDRRVAISAALKREGVDFSFFDAFAAPAERPENWKLSLPLWGCRQSHVGVLAGATGPTLVFEDDAEIPRGFRASLAGLVAELPEDWRVLRLGGDHVRPPEPFSPHLVRSRGAMYPHAYLVRNPSASIAGIERSNLDWGSFFMQEDRRNRQTYAANPWLVMTTGSRSDIPDSVPIAERAARHLAHFDPPAA